jgi:penicillin V acylase-like amidase (Ntn superfamily)
MMPASIQLSERDVMKKRKRVEADVIALLIFCLAVPRLARPCSSFAFPNKGHLVFGTNYDNRFAPGLLFINKRNVLKTGWEAGTSGKVAAWTSRYGSVTISCAGYQLAWGGMNEEGLAFATMFLNETRPPAPDERPPLAGAFWWQYILDTCATVEDLKRAAAEVRMNDTEDHYLVCDRSGTCAVVECLGGKMIIREAKDLPVKALTNASYPACLAQLAEKRPAPSNPYHSFNRFSRLASGLANFKSAGEAAAIDYAFGLLADVSHATDTRWSFVCDTGNRVFYLKSYKNPKVRSIDLKKIDFGCGRPTGMLDAHADLKGDITAAFRDYSHAEVLDHMIKALAYFRPGISKDRVSQFLGLLESFSCEPDKK